MYHCDFHFTNSNNEALRNIDEESPLFLPNPKRRSSEECEVSYLTLTYSDIGEINLTLWSETISRLDDVDLFASDLSDLIDELEADLDGQVPESMVNLPDELMDSLNTLLHDILTISSHDVILNCHEDELIPVSEVLSKDTDYVGSGKNNDELLLLAIRLTD